MTLSADVVAEHKRDTVRVLTDFVKSPGLWSTSVTDAEAQLRVERALREGAREALGGETSMLTAFAAVVRDDNVWQGAAPYQRQFMRSLLDAQVGRQVRFETSQVRSRAAEAPTVWRNLAIV